MPSDFELRTSALTRQMHRHMDGVTAESMKLAGVSGLFNYGVNIPTIRRIAAETGCDHQFAKHIYMRPVRELRMAALTIADPAQVTAGELSFWLDGAITCELLDEMAMRLISRTRLADEVISQWLERGDARARYAALMSLARTAGCDAGRVLDAVAASVAEYPDDMQIARAAAVFCSSLAADDSFGPLLGEFAGKIDGRTPAAGHILGELEWMM